MKIYALADCNSFYASCEQSFRPDLWKRPVVVLSNNDGCIIARSKLAKQIGIKMGEPFFKRKDFFQKHQVAVFSANFTLYGSLSNRIMNIFQQAVPNVEVYSIDESFLELTGIKHPTNFCRELRREVFKRTGLPISIGIGTTKTLAKLANHIAKKHPNFKGVCNLTDNDRILQRVFEITPVSEVWGIGRKLSTKLNKYNIYTVRQLINANPNWIKQEMSVTGLRTFHELNGFSCISLEEAPDAKKSIMVSRSFGQNLKTKADIAEALDSFTAVAAQKLRKARMITNSVRIILQTNPFKLTERQYNNSISIQLPQPTSSTIHLVKYANFALDKIFKEGYTYKKTGIMLSDFIPEGFQQGIIDYSGEDEKYTSLMNTIDTIQDRWGKESIQLASQGFAKKFRMRQERKSPNYTTKLSDILVLKI